MKNKRFKYIAIAVVTLLLIFLLALLTKPETPEFDSSKYEDVELYRNSEIEYYEYLIKQHEGTE